MDIPASFGAVRRSSADLARRRYLPASHHEVAGMQDLVVAVHATGARSFLPVPGIAHNDPSQ
ncbi:hypothetical protein [Streptomyces katrae]|uniref:hypothetical protein n=1 Tax=Streptomyces katrae TaxID=68223 RepID=UPI0004C00F98|nr:hypothetical protein [Streptomyces katrae]